MNSAGEFTLSTSQSSKYFVGQYVTGLHNGTVTGYITRIVNNTDGSAGGTIVVSSNSSTPLSQSQEAMSTVPRARASTSLGGDAITSAQNVNPVQWTLKTGSAAKYEVGAFVQGLRNNTVSGWVVGIDFDAGNTGTGSIIVSSRPPPVPAQPVTQAQLDLASTASHGAAQEQAQALALRTGSVAGAAAAARVMRMNSNAGQGGGGGGAIGGNQVWTLNTSSAQKYQVGQFVQGLSNGKITGWVTAVHIEKDGKGKITIASQKPDQYNTSDSEQQGVKSESTGSWMAHLVKVRGENGRTRTIASAGAGADAATGAATSAATGAGIGDDDDGDPNPKFDPKTGFPVNHAARQVCARSWQDSNSADCHQLPYAELHRVTEGFSRAHLLGTGGTSKVYRASLFGVNVAIKALAVDASQWDNKQFLSEMKNMCNMRHPNILRLFACSFDGHQRCLVLELLDGGALSRRIRQRRGKEKGKDKGHAQRAASVERHTRQDETVSDMDSGASDAQAQAQAQAQAHDQAQAQMQAQDGRWVSKGQSGSANANGSTLPGSPGGQSSAATAGATASGDKRQLPLLSWQQRLQVAVAIARALDFMHRQTPPIWHRDVKSSNVLLPETLDGSQSLLDSAKIADFGTAREGLSNVAAGETHASTNVVCGTAPYMPPEYMTLGQVSAKTDTFAFGILLVELLSGLGPLAARELTSEAEDLGEELEVHPGVIAVAWPPSFASRIAHIADGCTQLKTSRRSTIAEARPELEKLLEEV